MKKKSNILKMAICLCLMAVMFFGSDLTVHAEDGWGSYGDNLKWYFYEDTGLLEITGTGEIPSTTVTKIPPYNTYEDQVTSLTIGEGITSIGSSAFERYDKLKTVKLPSTLTAVGRLSFAYCGITELTLPNGFTQMDYKCFAYCTSLEKVVIPSSVTETSSCCFTGCTSLISVTLPVTLTKIAGDSFSDTGITGIHIPSSVTYIGSRAFQGCTKLISIEIPSSVTSLGQYALADCTRLQWVEANMQTGVPYGAFWDCWALQAVKLGDGVTSIDYGAFFYNSSLKGVWIPKSVTSISPYIFSGVDSTIFFAYQDTTGWEAAGSSAVADYVDIGTTAGVAKWNAIWKEAQAVQLDAEVTTVTLKNSDFTYTGKNIAKSKLKETVTYNGVTLKKGVDYTVKYPAKRKNVGTYKITLNFQGNYRGSVEAEFRIFPVKTTIKSLKKGSRSFTVKWAKKTKEVTGYEIWYSTSKKFTTYSFIKVTSNKTTQYSKYSLTGRKTYYVKVRTYKSINGVRYCSAWSKVKRVKTKK